VQEHRGEYPSLWAAIESIAPKIGCSGKSLLTWVKRHEIDHGQRFFRAGGAEPQTEVVKTYAYIEDNRQVHGVEPICKVLQVAPSAYRRHAARRREPSLRCQRARRDEPLLPQIQRVWQENHGVYGADKVWRQLNREGVTVARCTALRLMR